MTKEPSTWNLLTSMINKDHIFEPIDQSEANFVYEMLALSQTFYKEKLLELKADSKIYSQQPDVQEEINNRLVTVKLRLKEVNNQLKMVKQCYIDLDLIIPGSPEAKQQELVLNSVREDIRKRHQIAAQKDMKRSRLGKLETEFTKIKTDWKQTNRQLETAHNVIKAIKRKSDQKLSDTTSEEFKEIAFNTRKKNGKINLTEIAKFFGVHRTTVKNELKRRNLLNLSFYSR